MVEKLPCVAAAAAQQSGPCYSKKQCVYSSFFFFSFEEEEEEKGLNQGRQNRHSLTKATVTLCTVNKDIFNGRRIFLPIRSALSILYRHLEPVLQE